MRRSTYVVFALILTLAAGLALQPDDGTAVSRPAGVGLKVDGANHAKPLPRTVSVADFVPALSVAVAMLALVAARTPRWVVRSGRVEARAPRQVLARVIARRGPPALA